LAHEGSLVRKGLPERVKAPVEIDVVDDDSSSGRQGIVTVLQFKSDIAVAMGAVVDEQVDLAEFRKQFGKAPLA
jgi:hypothetical protein